MGPGEEGHPRKAKVEELGVHAVERVGGDVRHRLVAQDVLRLHVEVDDALSVQVG